MSTILNTKVVTDSDAPFVIDAVTREITTKNKKRVLIRGDHNSERFTFEVPRFIEGRDVGLCNVVQVVYINIDKRTGKQSTGVYTVDDMNVYPFINDVMTCTWLISYNATRYEGSLSFMLRFAQMDGDEIKYAWHTDVYEGVVVAKSLDAIDDFTYEYVDVIAQWKDSVMAELSTWVEVAVKNHTDVAQIGINKTDISELKTAQAVQKARMDTFTTLRQGSTTGDAELADIQIDCYGRKHGNAGDAVRYVGEKIDDYTKVDFTETPGYISGTDNVGGILSPDATSKEVYTNRIPCRPGSKFDIAITHSIQRSIWISYALYDTAGQYLSRITVYSGSDTRHESIVEITDERACYVVFMYRTYGDYTFRINAITQPELYEQINDVNLTVASLNLAHLSIIEGEDFSHLLEWKNGSVHNGVNTWSPYRIRTTPINVKGINQLVTTAADGYYVGTILYDADMNFIFDAGWKTGTHTVTVAAASYVVLVMCNDKDANSTIDVNEASNMTISGRVDTKIEYTENTGYRNTAGGISSASTNFNEKHTQLIPVTCGMRIVFTMLLKEAREAWVSYALFDRNGEFMNRPIIRTTTTNYCSDVIDINDPDVGYIEFSYRSHESTTQYTIDISYGSVDYRKLAEGLQYLYEHRGTSEEVIPNLNWTVKSINHRGFCTEAPENTLAAYKLSSAKGFEYVECDVSFTADNVPVLLHDSTIDRTSNSTGNIGQLTYAQVRQYDFGSWFSDAYKGEKIPTFGEFISLCKKLSLHPYIEIKNSGSYTQGQINNLVNVVKRYGMTGKVTYISFNPTYLGYVGNVDPQARLGLVVSTVNDGAITMARGLQTGTNEVFVDALVTDLTTDAVNRCMNADLPLEVWTCNDANYINTALDSYVSGVTSDNVHAGRELYKANK